ncbi:MAG: hypothetical protein LUC94_04415 [Clostridiales bacterium]|nr:hypothetical protein [Clostridiales bacterium]
MMWNGVFVCFLLMAAWQDLLRKRVDIRLYQGFACLAVFLAVLRWVTLGEAYDIVGHMAAMSPGLGLLGLGFLCKGGIGAGDGYFFLVSGMMLGIRENLMVLCVGTFLCGFFCMGYMAWIRLKTGENAGKRTVPFLPFAVIPGLWLVAESFVCKLAV